MQNYPIGFNPYMQQQMQTYPAPQVAVQSPAVSYPAAPAQNYMQNYPIGYNPYVPVQAAQPSPVQVQQMPVIPNVQSQTVPAAQNSGANGAVFNIAPPAPNSGANGVTINIMGASVNPNGANINNTYNTTSAPAQSSGAPTYYPPFYPPCCPPAQGGPSVPVGATGLDNQANADNKKSSQKDVVLLTDEYIQTIENYLRNDNPELKVMGAKALMERFREDESRKDDQALINLLNLALQSKYSQVKMIATAIIENGWTRGDQLTQQLLAQIQQSNTGYGLDALDAAHAALKSAGQTVKVPDLNPDYSKTKKKDNNKKA